MNATAVVRPEQIERLAMAVYPSFAMFAGMELDVFTTLKDGPLTGLQIAAPLGVDPIRLNPLLYALVAAGLLTIDGERFDNSPEASHFLVRGRPDYVGMRHHAYRRRWQTVLRTAEAIRTGVSEAPRVYAEMSAEHRDAYYLGLHTEARAAGRALAARQEFARYHRVADVGADLGVSPSRWRKRGPIFLRQSSTFQRRHQLPNGMSMRPGSATGSRFSERTSCVILWADPMMRRFFEEWWSFSRLRMPRDLLSRVSRALAPGGVIYVVGWILDDSRVTPQELATYNLQFATALDHGGVYTEGEIQRWLTEARFHDAIRVRSAAAYGADFMMARRTA